MMHLPLCCMLAGLFTVAWYAGGLDAPVISFWPVMAVAAAFVGGTARGLLWGGITITAMLGLHVAHQLSWVPEPLVSPSRRNVLRVADPVVACGILLVFAWLFESTRKRLFEKVQSEKIELARQKKMAVAQREVAERARAEADVQRRQAEVEHVLALEARAESDRQKELAEQRTAALADQTRVAQDARDQVQQLNEQLAARMEELRTLFDGLRQGVFSFGSDLRIGGHWSSEAGRIFERAQLQGVPVAEVLLAGMPAWDPERGTLEQWLQLVFETPLERFTELAELAPSELVLHPETEREIQLQLEVCPIAEAGALVQVLCLVTDVTERRRIEAREAESREQVELLRGMTDGGAELVSFLRSSEERWQSFATLLDNNRDAVTHAHVEELFRLAHTVKGDARLHSARELEETAAQVEQELQQLRQLESGALPDGQRLDVLALLHQEAVEAVSRLRGQLRDMSPVGEAIFDRTTVSQGLLQQVLGRLDEAGPEVRRLLEMLVAQPFGDAAHRLSDAAATWAAERDKQVVVQLEGVEVPVPGKLSRVLRGCLTHLVRNAVVHGIEAPAVREARGKRASGLITLRCEPGAEGVRVVVRDDGAGLDLAGLRAVARSRGLRWQEGMEQELIFADGLSTCGEVDELAGRGVGMSAVRADLRAAGYALSLDWEPGVGTRFAIEVQAARPDSVRSEVA